MPTTSRLVASGPGWRVDDVVCTAGPRDRQFEEQHAGICIAAVTHGSFRYRTGQGSALLSPGALLLGNDGTCFECGHEHAVGDRCLSFHYTPDSRPPSRRCPDPCATCSQDRICRRARR